MSTLYHQQLYAQSLKMMVQKTYFIRQFGFDCVWTTCADLNACPIQSIL